MFYNYSNLPNVNALVTQEIYQLMTEFNGLKIVNSSSRADAVLIGIIKSGDSLKDTRTNKNYRVAKNTAPEAIGESRRNFSIPARTQLKLSLHVIVIKNPTATEIKILQSDLGPEVSVSPKIIFNQMMAINGDYTREVFDGELTDINFTQNKGAETRSLKNMAVSAANTFREMILYAF
jgi:hypothetical protein